MKIVGYTRISVDLEEDKHDNTSIENQKRIIRDFVKKEFPDANLKYMKIATEADTLLRSERTIRKCVNHSCLARYAS